MFAETFSQFGPVKKVFFHSNPEPVTPPENVSQFFKDYPSVKVSSIIKRSVEDQ